MAKGESPTATPPRTTATRRRTRPPRTSSRCANRKQTEKNGMVRSPTGAFVAREETRRGRWTDGARDGRLAAERPSVRLAGRTCASMCGCVCGRCAWSRRRGGRAHGDSSTLRSVRGCRTIRFCCCESENCGSGLGSLGMSREDAGASRPRDDADLAARFLRDGYVVVEDVLSPRSSRRCARRRRDARAAHPRPRACFSHSPVRLTPRASPAQVRAECDAVTRRYASSAATATPSVRARRPIRRPVRRVRRTTTFPGRARRPVRRPIRRPVRRPIRRPVRRIRRPRDRAFEATPNHLLRGRPPPMALPRVRVHPRGARMLRVLPAPGPEDRELPRRGMPRRIPGGSSPARARRRPRRARRRAPRPASTQNAPLQRPVHRQATLQRARQVLVAQRLAVVRRTRRERTRRRRRVDE